MINHLCNLSLIKVDWDGACYTNLFMHDYRIRDRVQPLTYHDEYDRIPRGVIEHNDIVTKIPKDRYAVPQNLMLDNMFDKELGVPIIPENIEDMETFVKDFCQPDSETALKEDNEVLIKRASKKTSKERVNKVVSTADRKYLYFWDSYEKRENPPRILNKQD